MQTWGIKFEHRHAYGCFLKLTGEAQEHRLYMGVEDVRALAVLAKKQLERMLKEGEK